MVYLDGMRPDVLDGVNEFTAPEGNVIKCIKCFESASILAKETRGKDHASDGNYDTGAAIPSLPGDEVWGNFSKVKRTSGGYVRIWIASINDKV